MKRLAPVVAVLLLSWVAAGCGSTTRSAPPTTTAVCRGPAQIRAFARLHRDIAEIRTAAKTPTKDHLIGGPAVNRATDRFLLDLAHAPISNLERNRLIDFAATASVATCEQCFQALEAARPIPSIKHDGNGASCSR